MYESRNFLEPSFSPGLPKPEHPTPRSSGLWAAPGTLLALPGGLVRKRWMSFPPAVRKNLPAALDRFGALLGDREGSQLQLHPLGAGSPSVELTASYTHSKTGNLPFTGAPFQQWGAWERRLASHEAVLCCPGRPFLPGSKSCPPVTYPSCSPYPRQGCRACGPHSRTLNIAFSRLSCAEPLCIIPDSPFF